MSRYARSTTSIILTIVAVVFVLDQITKEIMLREIGPGAERSRIEVIPGLFEFRFVRNTGSAFGLFQDYSALITVLAIAAISVLGYYYMRHGRNDRWIAVAIGLQIGGAIGNVADRLRHGYVVDFIGFPRFPTFNVADSAITIGVVLLMYVLLIRDFQTESADRDRQVQQPGGDDS